MNNVIDITPRLRVARASKLITDHNGCMMVKTELGMILGWIDRLNAKIDRVRER